MTQHSKQPFSVGTREKSKTYSDRLQAVNHVEAKNGFYMVKIGFKWPKLGLKLGPILEQSDQLARTDDKPEM